MSACIVHFVVTYSMLTGDESRDLYGRPRQKSDMHCVNHRSYVLKRSYRRAENPRYGAVSMHSF